MLENNNYIDLRIFSASILLLLLLFFIMGFGLLIYYNLQLKKNIVRLNSMNNSFQVSITRKDLQLKDLHHRIKNNLQLIISLLNIEASKKNGDTIDEYLLKGQSRIHSIAAMHQNLYETEYYESIKLQNYIESIVRNMTNIYNNNIKIEINTNDTILEVDKAIPLGIIITELVSNSFKHAFIENNEGNIKIDIKKNLNKYELILQDNGVGFPDKPTSKVAIGLELVSMMVLQINGHLNRKNQQGAIYNISF
jgi:two-component sensor histidine kinase